VPLRVVPGPRGVAPAPRPGRAGARLFLHARLRRLPAGLGGDRRPGREVPGGAVGLAATGGPDGHPVNHPAGRTGEVDRTTKETAIRVRVDLDGTGVAKVATGVGFFDHMLEQLGRHSLIDLAVDAEGDLHVDSS